MGNASLSWLNLFVSDMQTGFGPFVSVYLSTAGWTFGAIGTVLSVSTFASLLAQVPAGIVSDAVSGKRGLAAGAILVTMAAAVLVALMPAFLPVLAAEAMQGAAAVVLGLSIAGITLSLSEHDRLGERFGNNQRFAAIGGAVGAGALGLVGDHIAPVAVFFVAAGFGVPALLALRSIHPTVLVTAPLRTGHCAAPMPALRRRQRPRRALLTDRRLLVLMGCVLLFHLANAGLLPLAAGSLAHSQGTFADVAVSAALIVPQLLSAAGSPLVGRQAATLGRKKLLLLGFAMLPLRALLFANTGLPLLILPAQVMDGVTSACFGVLVPLVVADITHEGGRFNLALGMVGLATSLGATVSTVASGMVANHMGVSTAFLALGAVGLAATLLVWLALPETRDMPTTPPLPPETFQDALSRMELARL